MGKKIRKKNNQSSLSFLVLKTLVEVADSIDEVGSNFSYYGISYHNRTGHWPRKYQNSYLKKVLRRLEQEELIRIRQNQTGPNIEIKITPKGYQEYEDACYQENDFKSVREWDERWRLVTFDVPEDKRRERDEFRRTIKHWGFEQVQRSVWVCPYPCDREITALCKKYEIEDYVSLFEGNYIGDDQEIRKLFFSSES